MKKTKQRKRNSEDNNGEIMNDWIRPLLFVLLIELARRGTAWSSGLWDRKEGFFWGFLAVFLFSCFLTIFSATARILRKGLTRDNSNVGMYNIGDALFAVWLGCVGYDIILLGWHHFGTGFWASVLLGIPGMVQGVVNIVMLGLILWSVVNGIIKALNRKNSDKMGEPT